MVMIGLRDKCSCENEEDTKIITVNVNLTQRHIVAMTALMHRDELESTYD